ncbi:MAG: hypothetical protein PVH24_04855 [Candidatus Zixiibacteriota bacterium]
MPLLKCFIVYLHLIGFVVTFGVTSHRTGDEAGLCNLVAQIAAAKTGIAAAKV